MVRQVVKILLPSLFYFLFFHQHLPSFTLDYSYLLYILALSISLLCYLKQLIFSLLCFQFFVQLIVCLVSCFCHFSLSLFSCSFIGQLACIIFDGIPYRFSFSLIFQFFLDFQVPPPLSRLPSVLIFPNILPNSILAMLRIISATLCQSSCPPSIPLLITFVLNLFFTFKSFSFYHFFLFTGLDAFLHFVQMIIALTGAMV